jgi:hypothetical protein
MELVSDPWDCSTDDSLAPGLSVSCENSTDLSQRHTLSRATKNIPSMREAARATKRVPCTKSSVVVSPSRVRLGRSSWLFFDSVISSIVRCGRLSLGWGRVVFAAVQGTTVSILVVYRKEGQQWVMCYNISACSSGEVGIGTTNMP